MTRRIYMNLCCAVVKQPIWASRSCWLLSPLSRIAVDRNFGVLYMTDSCKLWKPELDDSSLSTRRTPSSASYRVSTDYSINSWFILTSPYLPRWRTYGASPPITRIDSSRASSRYTKPSSAVYKSPLFGSSFESNLALYHHHPQLSEQLHFSTHAILLDTHHSSVSWI
jgi:hypothetical protein